MKNICTTKSDWTKYNQRPKKETYIYLGLVMKLAGLQRDQVSIFPTLLTIAHIASLLGCSYSLSTDFFGGRLSTLVLSVFPISITTYTSHSQFQQFPKRPFAGTSTLPYIDSPEMFLETIIQDPMTSVLVSFFLNLQTAMVILEEETLSWENVPTRLDYQNLWCLTDDWYRRAQLTIMPGKLVHKCLKQKDVELLTFGEKANKQHFSMAFVSAPAVRFLPWISALISFSDELFCGTLCC